MNKENTNFAFPYVCKALHPSEPVCVPHLPVFSSALVLGDYRARLQRFGNGINLCQVVI